MKYLNRKFFVIFISVVILLASFQVYGKDTFSSIVLASGLLDSGVDSGPKTWIEFPPDGETLPMAPVPIAVYAANPAGVGNISVTVNSVPVAPGVLLPLTSDGSSILVRSDSVWQPQAEGKYVLEANAGSGVVSVVFCIGTCQPPETEPAVTETASPTPTSTAPVMTFTPALTLTASPTVTRTPLPSDTPQYPAEVSFWANPNELYAGECADLNWDVQNARAVYLNGDPVASSGYQMECLCETTDYQLTVENLDNSISDYWLTINVSGSCEVPTDTEIPPEDTTGPDIGYTNLRWDSSSCQFFGQAGSITDPSGVASVTFFYNLNDEGWMSIDMFDTGDGYWEAGYGVSVNNGMEIIIGDVQYYVIARDSSGNENESSSSTYTFYGCDG